MTTHLVIPDPHAHPSHSNARASWLGNLIADVQPDVVINMGDQWDMDSLSSYDKGKRSFQGRSYRRDIDSGLEFSDLLWAPVKARKRKAPRRVFLLGNHEQRIDRALDLSPELDNTIGYKDLDLGYYHDIVMYDGQTPGVIEVDGIYYAHYFVSGVMGRPIGGEHPADSLLTKQFASCTAGHLHLADWSVRTLPNGRRIMGSVVGAYMDYQPHWAGTVSRLWWNGVLIKRNVEDGQYDPEWISIEALKREYGRPRVERTPSEEAEEPTERQKET